MKNEELANQSEFRENDIDFLLMFKVLYQRKLFILLVTFFVSLISIIYSLQIPNTYKSFAVLVPVTEVSVSDLFLALSLTSALRGM